MLAKGWFEIPGVQHGARTLQEQLTGLGPLMAEVRGQTVMDLGCAEGLISKACMEAGADVMGIEYRQEFVDQATKLGVQVITADLNHLDCEGRFDIVLMLAIVHKMTSPGLFLIQWASAADNLVVIRLPKGCDGVIHYKHNLEVYVDSKRTMQLLGFKLERQKLGPRGELVHYWRRCSH